MISSILGRRTGRCDVNRLRIVLTKPVPSTPLLSCHSNPAMVYFGCNSYRLVRVCQSSVCVCVCVCLG